MRKMQQHLKLL